MQQKHSTAAIILAAGSSSRMKDGYHKLLLPLDGRPVLTHVIDAALASKASPIVLVLGHNVEYVRAQIAGYLTNSDIILVENPDYLQGQSTSMHVGLATVQETITNGYTKSEAGNSIDSVVFLLGDQPLITTHIIDALITMRQTNEKQIIAPLYNGRRGNPILFASELFPELMEVRGDEGGRSVVENHRQELATIEVGNAAANYDMDTWEAYQEVLKMWQKQKSQETT